MIVAEQSEVFTKRQGLRVCVLNPEPLAGTLSRILLNKLLSAPAAAHRPLARSNARHT